jgi:hypothetical protein
MGISMKAIGSLDREKDLGFLFFRMAINMREIGRKMLLMERANSHSQRGEQFTKASFRMEISKARAK